MVDKTKNKDLKLYAWIESYSSFEKLEATTNNYGIFYGEDFIQGGSTPTPRNYPDYWGEVAKYVKEILNKKGLEKCFFYDGIAPPFKEWENNQAKAKQIPISAYNFFLLDLPLLIEPIEEGLSRTGSMLYPLE